MDILSFLVLIIVFILSYIYFVKKNSVRIKLINEFPGPKIYPFVGTALPTLWMTKYGK